MKKFLATLLFTMTLLPCFFCLSALAECEGDLNCDGAVDGTDLGLFAADFSRTGCATCEDLTTEIDDLKDRIAALEALLAGVTRVDNDITFSAVNVSIVNGADSTETQNGLGNLIVGYNEPRNAGNSRGGSHNLVVGKEHNFSSYGGLIAGYKNTISAPYATVTAGWNNTASGWYSTVSGGLYNNATQSDSSVSGGGYNDATGLASSVSGGDYNNATFDFATVSGGHGNSAGGTSSSVSGGSNRSISTTGTYDWRAGSLFQDQ